jgi:hypothetical protein
MRPIFCIALLLGLGAGCAGAAYASEGRHTTVRHDRAKRRAHKDRCEALKGKAKKRCHHERSVAHSRKFTEPGAPRDANLSLDDPGPRSQQCLTELQRASVPFTALDEDFRGIATPVQVNGPLGGITYKNMDGDHRLVLDCSLVYSLVQAGPMLRAEGLVQANYSSSYQIRNVRGTASLSKHSFGLALDVHSWTRDDGTKLSVLDDYEKGLGDDVDCVGSPSDDAARSLRTLFCEFTRGSVFRKVLTPDYNYDHRNHFHLEAAPWDRRTFLRPLVVREPSLHRLAHRPRG